MTLEEKIDRLVEDVGYIKGKLEAQDSCNRDWVARIGLCFGILWAMFTKRNGG